MLECEIKEFDIKYAKEISEIIYDNLYKINIKDYGKEYIDEVSKYFTENEIIKNFPNREKSYVAIYNNKVVGTASIDKFRGDTTGRKYIILTVFIKISNHKQGIGRLLINKIEEYAKSINAKEIVIPASIYGCEFYEKLGYEYLNGKKELNEEKEYTMIKKMN